VLEEGVHPPFSATEYAAPFLVTGQKHIKCSKDANISVGPYHEGVEIIEERLRPGTFTKEDSGIVAR